MVEVTAIANDYKKSAIAPVRAGDTVRVHQTIREGSKQRTQIFEGVVIRTDRLGSLSASATVRRIASGVGVEKSFLLHSPNVTKIEIIRRAKVRRNYLSYLRQRRGKSARLAEQGFDRLAVNAVAEEPIDVAETEIEPAAVEDAEEEVVASTDAIAEQENSRAAQADPKGDGTGDDENQLEAEEVKEGIDRAESTE